MARTSKSRGTKPFGMRSGNPSTFRMMGSSAFKKDKTAIEAYQSGTTAIQNAVNRGATSAEVRDMVVAHNSSVGSMKNAGKAKISYSTVKRYTPQEKIVTEEKTVVVPKPTEKKPIVPNEDMRENFGFLPKK
tara:strand:- start:267 stop:662 length:396 start_codon:yes stop_codon:yes gene_type:complete